MKTTYNQKMYLHQIEISDLDLMNAKPNHAVHLFFELRKAIAKYGDLPVKDGTWCELSEVVLRERQADEEDTRLPPKWLVIY